MNLNNAINIIGLAVLLGIVVRWGPNFATVINAVGSASANVLHQLTLADLQGQNG